MRLQIFLANENHTQNKSQRITTVSAHLRPITLNQDNGMNGRQRSNETNP